TVTGNVVGGNDRGIVLEPSISRVVFTGNSFLFNTVQVEVLGHSLAEQNQWSQNGRGNYWSDYVGFDADGDAIGDVPHSVEQFFEHLSDEYPLVGILRMSPAMHAMELAARAFPVVKPRTTVIDRYPLLRPTTAMAAASPSPRRPVLSFAGCLCIL